MTRAFPRKAFSIAGSFMMLGAISAPISPAGAVDNAAQSSTTQFTADGKSSATAAASCFEIKKNDPDSKSGSYWLYTPQMAAPAQFYCDQETDGGGWVMIGRGRQGWSTQNNGIGNPDSLASNPDGTDAFKPVQLPSNTVDALLNGKAPSELSADGLRIKRANSIDGSKNQEIRLHRDNIQDWSWEFTQPAHYSNLVINGADNTAYKATDPFDGRIALNSTNSNFNIFFAGSAANQWNNGFLYGPRVTGSPAADSYLWTPTEGGGYAAPFSQMFVRPEITQQDLNLSQIGDQGTEASTRRALPNSYSEKVKWRTSDETASGNTSELHTYVQAIEQVGNTVFTAGDFKYVENADTGEKVQQSYIAGYDVNTGELVRTFMPTFNGQIKALAALPGGKLVVGGEFTQVNGEAHNGIVVLDPATGAIDPSYKWNLESRNANTDVSIRSFDVQGNYLYIGGKFTHVKGSTSDTYAYSKNAARFTLNNKSVDWNWRPNFNGSLTGISANEAGTDVYASGYFSTVNGAPAFRLADLNTTDGKLARDWQWKSSHESTNPSAGFQLDVKAGQDTVWVGGSEHIIHSYNQNDLQRVSSSITRQGGDFQDILVNKGTVYGSCHCGDAIYQGADTWDSPFAQATDVHQIRLTAAFDEETGEVLSDFNPQISGKRGHGIWEQFVDSTGTLWVGGDINSSLGQKGTQKTVGFARFAPRDIVAPPTPTNLQVKTTNGKDRLTWSGVNDAGTVYQVLKNDRVIATVRSTQFELEHEDGARYFVRAMDAAGNYSASTPVATAAKSEPTAQPTPSTTASPSAQPSQSPTASPTTAPTATAKPSPTPTTAPTTAKPTVAPTQQPTAQPVVTYPKPVVKPEIIDGNETGQNHTDPASHTSVGQK
ncbi:fibrinogen-like YCDxxxxGGGW domain-containing protein [Rothia amarae]|uniref:fibrinogen-like YCDxxxxGGGW domain-containing protein n=1 Tax=Rothia amarae TaxID=169480 RepID=UPI001247BCC5